jgi:hypothetical protein
VNLAALRRPHPPSAMTIGGLFKHLAFADHSTTVRPTG